MPAELQAWRQIKPEFKVEQQPKLTEYIFSDIVAQFTKEVDVDLFTPRVHENKLVLVGDGLHKYITLKLDHAKEVYFEEFGHKSNHDTSDEELLESQKIEVSDFRTTTNLSQMPYTH